MWIDGGDICGCGEVAEVAGEAAGVYGGQAEKGG